MILTVSQADVEAEITRLFGGSNPSGLVIRVHGEGGTGGRTEAFRELLSSLAMYEYPGLEEEITVKPPDATVIAKALSVLGTPQLRRRVFERILLTFGKRIVDPLGKILDTTPEGKLFARMSHLRESIMTWIGELKLTYETQKVLTDDLRKLLTNEYFTTLVEHEEKIQRPRVAELAQQILQLVGNTFERAFRHWPNHASIIATAVARRLGPKLTLRESPLVIRERIIEGIEEYLWIETSMELNGALKQLFSQPQYHGIIAEGAPELKRETYRQFAEACWDIIAENC